MSLWLWVLPVVWQVIEPVLRADVGLPCAVHKHLAQVETKALESLAWTSESPLWEEIRANEGRLPTCQEVATKAHNFWFFMLAKCLILHYKYQLLWKPLHMHKSHFHSHIYPLLDVETLQTSVCILILLSTSPFIKTINMKNRREEKGHLNQLCFIHEVR